jgi:DNA-binding NarL/FixJ family response regulator
MKTRILIVEDQALIRHGIYMTLKEVFPAFEYFQASDGLEAYHKAREHEPHLVLMDYQMPRRNGLEAIELIKGHLPGTRFIMVYAELSDREVFTALSLGVCGFVLKVLTGDELILAVREVMAGRTYMTGHIIDLARLKSEEKIWKKDSTPSLFSPREQEVLKLVMEGLTSREIAEKLSISKRTVDRHRGNILARCGARTQAELVKFALEVA